MDLDVAGKSVIITGGASNIGRGIVLAYALEGANITIGDIDQQQSGAIVSISPDASWQREPKEAGYGGVKAAVNSCMQTIARENGRYGIRCNVVCPGVTIPEEAEDVGSTSMWSDPAGMFSPSNWKRWPAPCL